MESKENNYAIREEELEEIRARAIEKAQKARHVWRQKGPWLRCSSCEFNHGVYIGIHKRMVGETKEGAPILKDVNRK